MKQSFKKNINASVNQDAFISYIAYKIQRQIETITFIEFFFNRVREHKANQMK